MSELLDRLDEKLQQRGSPRSTRRTYGLWVERYFRHILRVHGGDVHPAKMGSKDVEQWLTHLAVSEHLAPDTQNVALNAVLFLYRHILEIDLQGIDALRSKKPKRLPTVLTIAELSRIFAHLSGVPLLVAKLQTGCGLRIGEAVSLRIKDLDFEREQLTVRFGKGAKDRVTCFPKQLHAAVQQQIKSMSVLFENDRRSNNPGVSLPYAFGRKCKSVHTSWSWFYLFTSGSFSRDPDSDFVGRHHIDASHINRQFANAARVARITKRVTSHAFRHSFATHMLTHGTPIMDLAQMMGHNDIRTTQIYLHVNMASGEVQRTPFGEILANPQLRRAVERRPQRLRLYTG